MTIPSVSSFMQVINATIEKDGGLVYPGEYMPSGVPVTAAGATKEMLLTNRSIAEQWFEAVKAQHEKEEEERDNPPVPATVPEASPRREAPAARQPEYDAAPVEAAPASLEATLQASCARWSAAVSRLDQRIEELEKERQHAVATLAKAEAALLAVLSLGS